MKTWRLVIGVALIAGLGVTSVASAGTLTLPVVPLPAANIAPVPNFLVSGGCTVDSGVWSCANPCVGSTGKWETWATDPNCTNYVLEAINNARGQLGEPAMVLPSNWYTLSDAEQLFVVVDLERVGLGYPAYVGLNVVLNTEAQKAATAFGDPGEAPGFTIAANPAGVPGFGGAWAGAFSVLVADYIWMYDDGWGGTGNTSNIACTSATAPGCWGHREQLLGAVPGTAYGVGTGCTTCLVGAANVDTTKGYSQVVLIEIPKGPKTTTFTWAQESAYFGAGELPTTTTLPPGQGLPGPVHISLVNRGAHSLSVRWTSPHTPGVHHAYLQLGTHANCSGAVQLAEPSYAPSRNVMDAIISVEGSNLFARVTKYYVRVFLQSTSGGSVMVSQCLALGRI